ncbi:MAG: hypothetical protein K2X81_24695, partial [Candidatus Obscuribacterales bacterium]|nr:hypothetical protein [Candidatus Obscuribacterales bacterium]
MELMTDHADVQSKPNTNMAERISEQQDLAVENYGPKRQDEIANTRELLLSELLGGSFGKLDKNNDGVLTKQELAESVKNPSTRGKDLESVTLLYTFWDQFTAVAGKKDMVLSRDDINQAASKVEEPFKSLDYNAFAIAMAVPRAIERARNSENYDSNLLYANVDEPLKSITPEAIHQGYIGDCVFEAVLSSMAQSRPALIKEMIKDNDDGTYTVTFPGASDKPVTVSAPTVAE